MEKFKFQNWLIFLFCLLAAFRVAFYLAAFPFFNNVDEIMHFDLVMKYSEGHVPRSLEPLSQSSAHFMTGCSSSEYAVWNVDKSKNEYPLFSLNNHTPEFQKNFKGLEDYWTTSINYESGLAPLYYSIAGLWAKAGISSGFFNPNGCLFLYWIRSLNILFVILLVLISYKAAQIAFPQKRLIHIGVPLLTALLPQDTFYSIQNDVLSPICYGLTFIAMLVFIRSELPTYKQSFYAGAAMSLTLLVKTSNLPLLLLVLGSGTLKLIRFYIEGRARESWKTMSVFFSSTLVPVCVWFTWNLSVHGDITASNSKIKHFHWTQKPLSEWLNTSFLKIDSLFNFWSELMASFWRGEFVWSSQRLAIPEVDLFYWSSSFIFIVTAMISFIWVKDQSEKRINRFILGSYISLLLFIVTLSLAFDFTGSSYPSFEHPYFVSGRLISAALIPFLVLYILGFEKIFYWIRNEKIKIFILVLIAISITLSEYMVNKVAFSSNYNFFALIK
jgi:hypothetical protein